MKNFCGRDEISHISIPQSTADCSSENQTKTQTKQKINKKERIEQREREKWL